MSNFKVEKMHKKNPYCEYATCKHCGMKIGHRPYTRGWEYVVELKCKKPWPKNGMCCCEECLVD